MNIIWKRPDGGVAITVMAVTVDPKTYARELKLRGDIPDDYLAVAFAFAVPSDRSNRDNWRWDGAKITGI